MKKDRLELARLMSINNPGVNGEKIVLSVAHLGDFPDDRLLQEIGCEPEDMERTIGLINTAREVLGVYPEESTTS